MKIYVAIIDDTHADTDVQLFTTPEAAVEFAKKEAIEANRPYGEPEELSVTDYLYYAVYGDSKVCVMGRELSA